MALNINITKICEKHGNIKNFCEVENIDRRIFYNLKKKKTITFLDVNGKAFKTYHRLKDLGLIMEDKEL